MNEIETARSALNHLNPACSRDEWIRIGMAAKAAGLSFEDFNDWSKDAENYDGINDCKTFWKSIKESGGITAATLFGMAKLNGWPSANTLLTKNNTKAPMNPLDIWERCLPALANHSYIEKKQGLPDGLRYYPANEDELIICKQNVANYLVVPCWSNHEIQTLQFIPPDKGKKLNLPGASFNDGYFIVGVITDILYICEGIGHAWAINKVTNAAAIVCFSSGRMKCISKAIRKQHPNAQLIIVSDRDKENESSAIANEISGKLIKLPQDKPANYDVNDYLLEHGKNALRELLMHPVIEMPLDVTFAHDLPCEFTPPDELLEGVLIAGDGSVLYGDTNSGKTFLVIDMACAIARGIDWIERKTEAGLVIYLAAESPSSVQRRLQAYQKHHNVRVMNFAIVKNPINLFDGETDTDAIIQTVRLLEKQCGQKAKLIIGDTLARLSAGANESAGQDMSLVVRHFDRIRSECNAHFMLIHHSGKNAAAGARGWSGVRAAVDTEIEITDSPTGRCAEITKQRDLGSKGTRIGFKLETVTLGLTKWKSPATSCVVVPAEAPQKQVSKRSSEIGGAIVEYLRTLSNAVKKSDLRKHFDGQYTSGGIYRQINALKEAGILNEIAGYVSLVRNGAN